MFIWDFLLSDVMDQIIDWFYGHLVGFLGDFFALMGNMGVELFEMNWVQSIVLFFSYLAWTLYVTGLVVSCFETGIEYQNGRGNLKDAWINAIKGFMAVSLFTVAPIELYKLSVNLQGSFTTGITGHANGISELANGIITGLSSAGNIDAVVSSNVFGGMSDVTSPIMGLFTIILMGYAVIKVFFANLKRGGILLIQIAVGSLYMFSVPRGYLDGFIGWCKQIIGLCLTAFLQATILTAGLMVLKDNALLGLGLMLSAGEIPRIAGAFGLDTSTKANVMSAVYTAQAAVNTTRDRDYKITIKLQEGYYTGEIYYEYTLGGAMGHGLSFDTIHRIYEELTNLEYYEDEDWEKGYPIDKTGGFEYHNNCGFIIDRDNLHVHFVLHDQEGNKLEKTISKYELNLYIVGVAMTSCIGHGVKRDSRKCVLCKNFERFEGTNSGMCAAKKRKVSQETTICKYGFVELN